MRVFILEYITGGGFSGQIIPASLAEEGLLMRNAAIHDFANCDDVQVIACFDPRLPQPLAAHESIAVGDIDAAWFLWENTLKRADATLIIAPETGGVLRKLTELAAHCGTKLLGCNETAVTITSSKLKTYDLLVAANINTIPSYIWPARLPACPAYVAKMDDGAGCEDSAYFEDIAILNHWMQTRQTTHIVQPYRTGKPASLSILAKDGQAWVLSCNLQKIDIVDGTFTYEGSVLNGLSDNQLALQVLANRIAAAIPHLFGYLGIDVIIDGEEVVVVEINPRLTTSYVGLHEAMGVNPARLLLDLAYNDGFKMPDIKHNRVEVSLHE